MNKEERIPIKIPSIKAEDVDVQCIIATATYKQGRLEGFNEALQKVLEVVAEDKRIKEFYFLQKNIEALRKKEKQEGK